MAKRGAAEEEAAAAAPKTMPEKKVPCFNPFDKPKFQQMSPTDQKAYLKEMSEQLQRQQDAINSLSADQYKAARDAYRLFVKACGRRSFPQTTHCTTKSQKSVASMVKMPYDDDYQIRKTLW